MLRRYPWTLAIVIGGWLAAGPLRAGIEDNVEGLADLRAEIMTKVRSNELKTAGPWNLKYVGPLPQGALVFLKALPEAAFQTRPTAADGYEVRLKDSKALFTKVTGELRPIGVSITKTLEGPGLGRVYVTFQTKGGKTLDLEKLFKAGMIRDIEWSDRDAVSFIGYVGKEAGFERKLGHGDTPVRIKLTLQEEGDLYTFTEWLPRLGVEPEAAESLW